MVTHCIAFWSIGSLLDFEDAPPARASRVEDAAGREVHRLQWLVSGRTDTDEHLLPLNRLLCSLPLSALLPRALRLAARETETGQALLQGVVTHWSALGCTSVDRPVRDLPAARRPTVA